MCVEKYSPPEINLRGESFIRPNLDKFEAALINVPVDFQQGIMPDGEEPPIGLGRIASYANVMSGHKVGIFDVHRAKKPDQSRLGIIDVRETL